MGIKTISKFVTKHKAIICILLVLLTIFTSTLRPTSRISYAASTSLNFDNTDVLDDLTSSNINGVNFDIRDYTYKSNGEIQVITFAEYGYSAFTNKQSNYALYVYIYNPQLIDITTNSTLNTVQMALGYEDNKPTGEPNNYDKIKVTCCSVSEDSKYYHLFYKFKINFTEEQREQVLVRINNNSNERRYDLSGIELKEKDGGLNDHKIGLTYKFSGYSKGYGLNPNAENDLSVESEHMETISLDVHSTYRRTTGLNERNNQNQLNSVYFSVDNDILSRYGKLQRIKAEWYEYEMNPIVVTSNDTLYDSLKGARAKTLKYTYDNPFISTSGAYNSTYDNSIGYALYWQHSGDKMTHLESLGSTRGYNPAYLIDGFGDYLIQDTEYFPRTIYSVMKSDGDINVYDPVHQSVNVTSNDLRDYIYGYKVSYNTGHLPNWSNTTNDYISADLFYNDIGDYRKKDIEDIGHIDYGYSWYDFDADADDDMIDILSKDTSSSFWDNVFSNGFWNAIFGGTTTSPGETYTDVLPIYQVKDSDFKVADVAKELIINQNDVSDFEDYYKANKKATNEFPNGKSTFLFRFAATDYKAYWVSYGRNSPNEKVKAGEAYVATTSVFLGFDIIQLTFFKDGVFHTIPVVSNPIDITPGLTPPITDTEEGYDWFKLLMTIAIIFLVLIVLVIISPLLAPLLGGVGSTIKTLGSLCILPFKIIFYLFKNNERKK